jgi:hypothetical protein
LLSERIADTHHREVISNPDDELPPAELANATNARIADSGDDRSRLYSSIFDSGARGSPDAGTEDRFGTLPSFLNG